MPHGEDCSKQADHFDTICPLKADFDEVFRYFWMVGETFKQVISTHLEEDKSESGESTRVVRDIFIGRISIPMDGGPPRFNAIPERSRTMPFPHSIGNIDASIIPT